MTSQAARTSSARVLTIGFSAGLILRLSMVPYLGMYDMDAYYDWGQKALESGLPQTFHGIYFPLQYQIFMTSAWLSAVFSAPFWLIFKLANLLFDIGAFFLLVRLLERQNSKPAYALVYWLHPWLLALFSLGYVDFQFAFFVLLTVVLLKDGSARNYLIAGIPLGAAFLMKPQAQILMVTVFAYGAFHYARTRDARPLGMLVGPAAWFLAYEAYFIGALFGELGYRAAAVLPENYLGVVNVMPTLTADMLNLWYPIAYVLKQPGEPIYAISDQLRPLPHVPLKYAAAAVVLGLVMWHVSRVQRRTSASATDRFIALFGFASLVVPFVMTSAHENHLFLGSVFLVLFLAKDFPLTFKLAGYVLLGIQFLNIYGLYGAHPAWIAQVLRSAYSQRVALVYALISIPCFIWVLHQILRQPSQDNAEGRAGA